MIDLSNPDKVLFPDAGFTKADLVGYYRAISPAILPHLARRAITLVRFPDGIDGPGWFQMNCRGAPDWMATAPIVGRRGRILRYCLIEDERSLVWVANQGTIELHPFLGTVDETPPSPHAVVFDLDPGPPAGLIEAAIVAARLRDLLAGRDLEAYVKTSGRKGLHLYVPIEPGHSYAQTKSFARSIARELAASEPDLVIDRMPRDDRSGRVFIDWGQNDASKSTIAAWSLRAVRRPLVSAPLHWHEVDEAIRRRAPETLRFGPARAIDRFVRDGDPFAPVLRGGRRLPGA